MRKSQAIVELTSSKDWNRETASDACKGQDPKDKAQRERAGRGILDRARGRNDKVSSLFKGTAVH